MNLRYVVERLRDIRSRWKGQGRFDYNTMFIVKQDAEEAIKLVEAFYPKSKAIPEFKEALKLAESEGKEEDHVKRDAIGALEYGIHLFFNKDESIVVD